LKRRKSNGDYVLGCFHVMLMWGEREKKKRRRGQK